MYVDCFKRKDFCLVVCVYMMDGKEKKELRPTTITSTLHRTHTFEDFVFSKKQLFLHSARNKLNDKYIQTLCTLCILVTH